MVFKDRLRAERIKKNYTQLKLAEMIGVSKTSLCLWENGLGKMSVEHLEAWAEALEMQVTVRKKKKKTV